MADDQWAGPAKQVAQELLGAGIDMAGEAAVQRWIDARNSELAGGRRPCRRRR